MTSEIIKPARGRPPKTELFDWGEYLIETKSIPAPANCFKHSFPPPINSFAPGMKLEAVNPQNPTSVCVATVKLCEGPRLRLQVDGSSLFFWRFVDSPEIQPIGTCEKNGGVLESASRETSDCTFREIGKHLNEFTKAPNHCFLPEPETPPRNMFEKGMKLEALDRKHNYLICVATVGDVSNDKIKVTFDGWDDSFDYWAEYYSRDIFPVGWCRQSSLRLELPPRIPAPATNMIMKAEPGTNVKRFRSKSNAPRRRHPSPGRGNRNKKLRRVISTDSKDQPQNEVTLYIHADCEGGIVDAIKLKKFLPRVSGTYNELHCRLLHMLNDSRGSPCSANKIVTSNKEFGELQEFMSEIRHILRLAGACQNLISVKQRKKPCSLCCSVKEESPTLQNGDHTASKQPISPNINIKPEKIAKKPSAHRDIITSHKNLAAPANGYELQQAKLNRKNQERKKIEKALRKLKHKDQAKYLISSDPIRVAGSSNIGFNKTQGTASALAVGTNASMRQTTVNSTSNITDTIKSANAFVHQNDPQELASNDQSQMLQPNSELTKPQIPVSPNKISSDQPKLKIRSCIAEMCIPKLLMKFQKGDNSATRPTAQPVNDLLLQKTAKVAKPELTLDPALSSNSAPKRAVSSVLEVRSESVSLSSDLSKWTVDDVIQHVEKAGCSMNSYADKFREQEINGEAVCLISPDMMLKYLELPLGPAVKIYDIIQKGLFTNNVNSTLQAPSDSMSAVSDTSFFSVEDVIRHIESKGVNMTLYGETFRKHEVDGKAMGLIDIDMMIKYMQLTLGTAVRIHMIFKKDP